MPFAPLSVDVPHAATFNGKFAVRPSVAPLTAPAPNIRLIQVTPTGSIDILKILTAFAHGADGVVVTWVSRATDAQRSRLIVLRELLHFVGCERERIALIDGAPDESIDAFAQRVRKMGPWAFNTTTDLSAELTALPLRNVSAHAPAEASKALRKVAVELLQSGRVAGVLAWGQGSDEIRPMVARTPEQAARLFAGGRGYPNLTTVLETIAEQHIALVVRPVELACIQALREDGIFIPQGLFLIGQGVPAAECDVLLPGPVDSAGLPAGDELAALEAWSLSERTAFWSSQFANCVQCDGCRSACPFQCYTRCLGDSMAPHNGHAPTALQTACAHIACAVRLAGHCVQCQSCTAACPQAVPLYVLHQKAEQVLKLTA